MSIKRMDHTTIVVEDLPAAITFFTALGMKLEGEATVEGSWVDRLCGLNATKADIAMMLTPDGHGRLELTKYLNPKLIPVKPSALPPNTLGIRQIMFLVEHLDDTITRMRKHGAELMGEVVQYENLYR